VSFCIHSAMSQGQNVGLDPDVAVRNQPRAACSAIMSSLIRGPRRRPRKSDLWQIIDTASPVRVTGNRAELDHFFEIQHIVDSLFRSGVVCEDPRSPNWVFKLPLADFVTLSGAVSLPFNIYSIDAAANGNKKHIPYANYLPGPQQHPMIRAYLDSEAVNGDGDKVKVVDNLKSFALGMSMWPSEHAQLIITIGQMICRDFGWDWEDSDVDIQAILDKVWRAYSVDEAPDGY
jgi:hypothetical protein